MLAFFFLLIPANIISPTARQLKIDAIHEKTYFLLDSDLDFAMTLANKALKASNEIDYEYGAANSFYIKGYIYEQENDYVKATLMYLKSITRLSSKIDNKSLKTYLNVIINCGRLLGVYHKYDEALECYDKGIEVAEKWGLRKQKKQLLYNKAYCLRRKGDSKQSIGVLKNMVRIASIDGDHTRLIRSYNLLGLVHKDDGFYSSAREYYDYILRRNDASLKYKAIALHNTAVTYVEEENYEKAREYFEKALVLKRELGSEKFLFNTLYDLSELHIDLGNPREAEHLALEAEKLYSKLVHKPETFKIYRLLNQLYEAKNDLEQTEYYGQRYQEMLRSFHKDQKEIFEKDQFEIDQILERYREEQEAEERKVLYHRVILWLSVFMFAAIMFALMIYFRQQAVKRKISTIFKDHLND